MKTINIHGKKYVPVSERLIYFRENYKDFSLTTDIIELTDTRVVMKSIVKDKNGREIANGHAYEILGSTNVNKTSFLELKTIIFDPKPSFLNLSRRALPISIKKYLHCFKK